MRGVFNKRPALPKNTVTWDTQTVLSFLDGMSCTTLKMLTLKTVMLMALLTGQRAQALNLIDLRNISVSEKLKIRFGDLLKQSRPGFHQHELQLDPFLSNDNLCVVSTVKTYITQTKALRGNVTKLFISWNRPHRAITTSTISRWIKTVLKMAGIDISVFTPHSTRSAAMSAASRSNVPLATILKTAGWSSESTFAKFYNKPIQDGALFGKILPKE